MTGRTNMATKVVVVGAIVESEATKRCSKCGEEKGVGEFYKNRNKKDGLDGMCKACKKAYKKSKTKYYQKGYNNKEAQKIDQLSIAEKECKKCHCIKLRTEFNVKKGNSDDLRYICKACESEYKKTLWKEKANTPEAVAYRRNYYKAHKEGMLAQNKRRREKTRETDNAKKAQNRERYNQRLFEYFGGSCAICGLDERCYEVYDCHHFDAELKEKQISTLIHKDWELEVVPELEKCVYLCSNCHKKIHKGRFDTDITAGKLVLIPGKKVNK